MQIPRPKIAQLFIIISVVSAIATIRSLVEKGLECWNSCSCLLFAKLLNPFSSFASGNCCGIWFIALSQN